MTLIKDGTYKGEIQSPVGFKLEAILRWESRIDGNANNIGAVSADFFTQSGDYYASFRSWIREQNDTVEIFTPSVIFKGQDQPDNNGWVKIVSKPDGRIELGCHFPNREVEPFQGTLAFDSEFFRRITIRIGKTKQIPALQELPLGGDDDRKKAPFFDYNLKSVFKKEGIAAEVVWLEDDILKNYPRNNGKDPLYWDEKELHDLMESCFEPDPGPKDWVLNLMILPGLFGDYKVDQAGQPQTENPYLVGMMFDRSKGNQSGSRSDRGFQNEKPRQGAAIFWDALKRKSAEEAEKTGHLRREYLFWIMHELGHILNLKHPLGCIPDSFMSYPDNHPEGESQFWKEFEFSFNGLERFHLRHGFYPEVCPGVGNDFLVTHTDPFYLEQNQSCRNPDLEMTVRATKPLFQFMEPVTLELALKNNGSATIPIPYLSPGFGEVKIMVRKPSGTVMEYMPPVQKCPNKRTYLPPGAIQHHLTSIFVNQEGFWLDEPGRYRVRITVRNQSTDSGGEGVAADFLIAAPADHNIPLLESLLDREVAMFIYLEGGEHFDRAKAALLDLVYRYPDHPLAPQANLVLGLNYIRGQKSAKEENNTSSNPVLGAHFLCQALLSRKMPKITERRLFDTLMYYKMIFSRFFDGHFNDIIKKYGGRGEQIKIGDFVGSRRIYLKKRDFKGKVGPTVEGSLSFAPPPREDLNKLSYSLRVPADSELDQDGSAQFVSDAGESGGYLDLKAIKPGDSSLERYHFSWIAHFELNEGKRVLKLSGTYKLRRVDPGGGEMGGGGANGNEEGEPPPPPG